MASRLATRLTVHGFNIAEPRLRLAEAAGVRTFASAREVAEDTDALLLAVRIGELLNCVHFGAAGVASALKLLQAKEIAEQLAGGDRGAALPSAVAHDDDAAAIYGALGRSFLESALEEFLAVPDDERAATAKTVVDIVRGRMVINFWTKPNEQNALATELDDYFYDFGERHGVQLRQSLVDSLTTAVLKVARARFTK